MNTLHGALTSQLIGNILNHDLHEEEGIGTDPQRIGNNLLDRGGGREGVRRMS